ncbi:holo-ACP synthase [Undibacterium griseum]|uniref:Holo-[acyl-carrier-protein] synthase n=1 Tax=Undibacterium griseum TaxID=2762295 RepID=A0ABR6YP66_9BURK|nr:holo-ACP synthase [Undibacterium griseum]MBC3885698.1 holo-ACP synthase [Undibacterium griseum]
MHQVKRFSAFTVRRRRCLNDIPQHHLAIGTDLVWIPEIRQSMLQFGARYLNRLFTPDELNDCQGSEESMTASLAARIAAKEAVMKLLGVPAATALPWKTIEVRRMASGQPRLQLYGAARRLARQAGITLHAISLSHEKDYATATVIGSH